MNKELISQIANEVVQESILENWLFYLLIILLSFVGSYIASYVSSYAKKRGEHLATKADLDEIKLQLKATTELTTTIKQDIEHQVWRKQQIETTKREKLEEYLQHIYATQENLSTEMYNKYFYSEEKFDFHSKNKANMLYILYFPELNNEHNEFLSQYRAFKRWLSAGMTELVEKRKNGDSKPVISEEHMKGYPDLLSSLNAAVSFVEKKATKISETINDA